MAVRVLVSRQFDADSVEAAKTSFKSLADAGWSVLVDASDVSPPTKAPTQPSIKKRSPDGLLVDAIVEKHGMTLLQIGRLVGVTQGCLSNYRAGRFRASKLVLCRLRRLANQDSVEEIGAKKAVSRRIVRKLTDDQRLDIAVRVSSGESQVALAREFGISRSRVSRIAERLEA
jgi:transcriptional regulator with XRE-family HTH domain